jgi:hypothetical protein
MCTYVSNNSAFVACRGTEYELLALVFNLEQVRGHLLEVTFWP